MLSDVFDKSNSDVISSTLAKIGSIDTHNGNMFHGSSGNEHKYWQWRTYVLAYWNQIVEESYCKIGYTRFHDNGVNLDSFKMVRCIVKLANSESCI